MSLKDWITSTNTRHQLIVQGQVVPEPARCVQCGLCEQACPNMIPLMEVFIPAAENAQKEFAYYPGKDKAEKIPMIVYREDEFLEVGEK